MEWQHRHERAELVCGHGRQSWGMEQETGPAYQSAMQEPILVGAEARQAQGLSISLDRQGQKLGIERVRDGPDIG